MRVRCRKAGTQTLWLNFKGNKVPTYASVVVKPGPMKKIKVEFPNGATGSVDEKFTLRVTP